MHRALRPLATIAVAVSSITPSLSAQFVERAPLRSPTDTSKPRGATEVVRTPSTGTAPVAELLQQAAIDYSPAGAKVRLKVTRLWLEVTDRLTLPVVIVANPTILLPDGKDSVTFTAKELLSQFGGLLNVAVVKPWRTASAIEGQKGMQGEFRLGAKLVEFGRPDGGAVSTTTVANAGISISHLMRAFGERPTDGADAATAPQVGLVTVNLRGGVSYLGGDRYRQQFAEPAGNDPPEVFATYQLDMTIHLFDQFFVAAGLTGSTNKRLGDQGFVGVTVSRANKK